MRARVEFRLASIFAEPCDLLVIPSSADGSVTPEMEREIRKAALPLPKAIPLGTITLCDSGNPLFPALVYAAVNSGHSTSAEIVEQIGREIGRQATERQFGLISAPLLGAGSGDLTPAAAGTALSRGFKQTAPETATLVIHVRGKEVFSALAHALPRPDAGDLLSGAGTVKQKWPALRGLMQRHAQHSAEQLSEPRTPNLPPDPQAHPSPTSPSLLLPAAAIRQRVFVSYCHRDATWLERLQKHLRPLEREGLAVWDDTRLKPGEPWREEIREAMAKTKVAILLISPDFLASEFIATDELPPLLKAAEEDGATILPVIVSHCRFDRTPSLSRFQAVNDPAKPLVRMGRGNRDKVFDDVARAVEDALKQ